MRMTSSSVKAAQHGSQFFHKFPTAADEIEQEIKTRGIAGIFHYAAKIFPKEISEHQAASSEVYTTKGNIRELSRKLYRCARHLRDAANLTFSMLGRDELEIELMYSKNDVANYENLTVQIRQHEKTLLDKNETIRDTFQKFEADLQQYKKELSKIGEAIAHEEKEESDVGRITAQLRPILSGLKSLLSRYFYLQDRKLYEEWRVKRSVKSKEEEWVEPGFRFLRLYSN